MRGDKPIRCVIFDLSEVFIGGLPGIEKRLSKILSISENEILPRFSEKAPILEAFKGLISEDIYLTQVIESNNWNIELSILKQIIRENFHSEVDGTLPILREIASRYKVALLSDHIREWASYIKSVHSFLDMFNHTFFSFELGKTKRESAIFSQVIDVVACSPDECLFIDDRFDNVNVAKSVGIHGVQFLNAGQLRKELKIRQMLPPR